ncbi:hypothetical protein BpHYR1_019528 [Brachionus plicatilis]|uniref:Uncharacterized protein n=1 Tax=Brachionus plicatilis TaxID=10195 RepID=A0A3M7PU63_BRAPC|nr:hypothetical protein BpHYR1_019528 [Brachionus plicatilis]
MNILKSLPRKSLSFQLVDCCFNIKSIFPQELKYFFLKFSILKFYLTFRGNRLHKFLTLSKELYKNEWAIGSVYALNYVSFNFIIKYNN